MASCNTNGLLKYYADVILNGDNLISLSQPFNISDNDDSSERKYNCIMAPRTDLSFASMPVQVDGTSDVIKNECIMGNEVEQSVSNQQVSPDVSQNCLATDSETLTSNPLVGHTPTKLQNHNPCDKFADYEKTLQNHALLTQRLSVCSQRLFHNRTRALSLLTRLLACNTSVSQDGLLPIDSLPSIISPNMTYEDTESSTDDEADAKEALSSSKQSWLYTRSVTHSNWHWLCTEIKHADKCLHNLYMLKHNDSGKPSQYQSSSSHITGNDAEEVTCSRTFPYKNTKQKRHSYHNLSSPRCSRVIQELNKHSIGDPYIKCSCIPPFVGPCILCCGSEPNTNHAKLTNKSSELDLLSSAHSLSSHIHPKLSVPGDVQLALRIESRLAAYSPVHFRPHKATVHCIQPWDKPNCLQPLGPPNCTTPVVSNTSNQFNQIASSKPKSLPSQSRNSRLRKRRLLSSRNSRVCPLLTYSTKLPPLKSAKYVVQV
ncbi:hypothetical protein KSF78_0004797 [Schistosoma japonicum]|nr:hypothetical protein KSF78_0004797 [Schistosoma japonicum]